MSTPFTLAPTMNTTPGSIYPSIFVGEDVVIKDNKIAKTSRTQKQQENTDNKCKITITKHDTHNSQELKHVINSKIIYFRDKDSFLASYDMTSLRPIIDLCKNYILENKLLIKNPPIFIFGKKAKQRRSIAFFSDSSIGYRYSRQLMKSQPIFSYLQILLEFINKVFNCNSNGVLINYYEDGNDYIGAHSDDETGLIKDNNIGIIAISVGCSRKFRIRKKSKETFENGKKYFDVETKPYRLIQMGGTQFQKQFTHEIPIQKKIKGWRMSFTFRNHIE